MNDAGRKSVRHRVINRATIKGTLVIGIVQGLLGGIGFSFVGIQGLPFGVQ